MRLLLFLLLFLFSLCLYSQHANDSITTGKSFLSTVYKKKEKILTPNEMLLIMNEYPQAYDMMQQAKNNYDAAMITSIIGGFCMGFPIGTRLAGGEFSWPLFIVGTGFTIASIPLSSGYHKHARDAVKIYNNKIVSDQVSMVALKIGAINNGFGFIVIF